MSKLSASPADNSSSERHNYINVDADNKFAAKIRSKTIIDNQHMTQEHKGSLTWTQGFFDLILYSHSQANC